MFHFHFAGTQPAFSLSQVNEIPNIWNFSNYPENSEGDIKYLQTADPQYKHLI